MRDCRAPVHQETAPPLGWVMGELTTPHPPPHLGGWPLEGGKVRPGIEFSLRARRGRLRTLG